MRRASGSATAVIVPRCPVAGVAWETAVKFTDASLMISLITSEHRGISGGINEALREH
jgi:hypothetical protein